MNTKIKNRIIDHSKSKPDEEVCGYIYYDMNGEPDFTLSENLAPDKKNNFIIDSSDYINLKSSNKIIYGIYHSHPFADERFSDSDIETSEEMELPIFTYSLLSNKWNFYFPKSYKPNFTEQVFCWGFSDCLELVKNYFETNKNAKFFDYDRDESFLESNTSAIIDGFENEGFVKVPLGMIKKDNVLLFNSNKYYPHHLGIFIGNSRILHQPLDGLSRITQLNDNWMKKLSIILEYRGKGV